MKRSGGMVGLSLGMTILGIVGLLGARGVLSEPADDWLSSPTTAAILLVYGASAMLTGVGLWFLKPWGITCLWFWLGSLGALCIHMLLGPFSGGWFQVVPFFAICSVLVSLTVRYVRRQVLSTPNKRVQPAGGGRG